MLTSLLFVGLGGCVGGIVSKISNSHRNYKELHNIETINSKKISEIKKDYEIKLKQKEKELKVVKKDDVVNIEEI